MSTVVQSLSKTIPNSTHGTENTENLPSTQPVTPQRTPKKEDLKRKRVEVYTPSPNKKKAFREFKEHVGLSTPEARSSFKEVAQDAESLRFNSKYAFYRSPNSKVPGRLVFKEGVSLFDRQGRRGTNASTMRVTTILFSDESPKRELLKRARKPFTPQKDRVQRVSSHPGCDTIGRSGTILNASERETRFAFFVPSQGDLTTIKYEDPVFDAIYQKPPVQFILSQLTVIADFLAELHKDGKVHRDLKGANLLYNIDGPGKATDFEMVRDAPSDALPHFVGMTPEYAPGFIWANVTDQRLSPEDPKVLDVCSRNRWRPPSSGIFSVGRQTPEADVAGFAGITLETDVIVPIIKGLSKRYGIENPLDLSPIKVSEPFTDERMRAIADNHPGRAVYRFPNPAKGTPGHLLLYPSRDEANTKIEAAIKKLEGHHPQEELSALSALKDLSYKCKSEDPQALPTMEVVTKELQEINKPLLASEQG